MFREHVCKPQRCLRRPRPPSLIDNAVYLPLPLFMSSAVLLPLTLCSAVLPPLPLFMSSAVFLPLSFGSAVLPPLPLLLFMSSAVLLPLTWCSAVLPPLPLSVLQRFSYRSRLVQRSFHRSLCRVPDTASHPQLFGLHGSFEAPTMEPHRAKLRRLAAVGVSQTKLLQIIDTLRDDPFDDDFAVSRYAFKGAFAQLWAEAGCIIKLPTTSGEFEWECLSLPKALCTMVKHSHAFKTVLSKLFQTTPCTADTPYNLVVYADEVCESVWGKQPPSCTAKVSRRRCSATLHAHRCRTAVGRLQHFPGGARKCSAARQSEEGDVHIHGDP